MTSKDDPDAGGRPVPSHALSHVRKRDAHHALIQEGSLRPDTDDLLAGADWLGSSMVRDIGSWCDYWLLTHAGHDHVDGVPAATAAVNVLRESCSLEIVKLVEAAVDAIGDTDSVLRMRIYRCCLRDPEAHPLVLAQLAADSDIMSGHYNDAHRDAVAMGLVFREFSSMDVYREWGANAIALDQQRFSDLSRARAKIVADSKAAAAQKAAADDATEAARTAELMAHVRGVDPQDPDFIRAVMEDRAEFWSPTVREIVVVPAFPEGGSSHRRDIQKSWAGMDGQALPVVMRGDVAAHRGALVARWPHAAELIDVVLTDLAVREEVRFRPTLFVGPPGSGKSSLARAIADQVGLPSELYNMAGMADASLGGTSAQWSTAREAVPLQLIKRARSASVCVIWDEVEKAGTSRHNGSALDVLLPLLEADQARRFRDLTLEVECDLSFVSNFGTANSVADIPAPLRDRMRILVMPEPGWEHLGTLTKQIIERIARERGVDPRWHAPLAEDEMDLIREAWPGGSIRQLSRIVTTIVDGRDRILGRC